MAGGWHPVGPVLERSGERAGEWFGNLLVLEGRTSAASGRTAIGRDGGDPAGVGRSRNGVLHDARRRPAGEPAHRRRFPARRPSPYEHPGRPGQSEVRRAYRRAADVLEINEEHVVVRGYTKSTLNENCHAGH